MTLYVNNSVEVGKSTAQCKPIVLSISSSPFNRRFNLVLTSVTAFSGDEISKRAECTDVDDLYTCFYTAVNDDCEFSGSQCQYSCGLC